ncbi:hypothetical protein KIN20_027966 [Parelaphostrongylus tenuis]|uniref:Glucuronosyltransferase n=1 Tax=Parelaphostrongylus tenuis TaxID=148309 RepID=A0AAD5WEA7_PARTN|nr:hypothetical protein KIN20_027966 [Parelaphostrongylus tenuis]
MEFISAIMCRLIFIYFSLFASDAYKFLINSPLFGYSHTNFMGSIADTLTEAGHNVTVLMPVMNYEHRNRTGLKLTKNVIKIPLDPEPNDVKYQEEMISHMWAGGTSAKNETILGFERMKPNLQKNFVPALINSLARIVTYYPPDYKAQCMENQQERVIVQEERTLQHRQLSHNLLSVRIQKLFTQVILNRTDRQIDEG